MLCGRNHFWDNVLGLISTLGGVILKWDYPDSASCLAALRFERMRKTLRSADHTRLIALLRETRTRAALTQQQVADALGSSQSFIAKYENGERRLDVVEFIAIARALKTDPLKLLRKMLSEVRAAYLLPTDPD